jgi:hypothetical protein
MGGAVCSPRQIILQDFFLIKRHSIVGVTGILRLLSYTESTYVAAIFRPIRSSLRDE